MQDRIKHTLDLMERLLRDADDMLAGSYDKTASERVRLRRRRNSINAACNAMHRALNA